ncbi:uncharacterized protein LOC117627540 [Prunus dulcis]|uniref:uncharacterized protein LOC117627540 n=1 Tax=Prunus dulcis TaxID=3755 RepID=UPI0014828732|nr:uncharacterized protein LOC117627540 [Prunus dulcis]
MRDDETLSGYLTHLNELINQMKTFGEVLSNARLMQKVLINLSKPYDPICLVIENTKNIETVELQEILAILKSQEQRFDMHTVDATDKAFASSVSSKGQQNRGNSQSNVIKASQNATIMIDLVTWLESALLKNLCTRLTVQIKWSGCSNHMTGNVNLLIDVRTNVAGKVQMPTGDLVNVAGMGSLVIDTTKGRKYIKEVMYLPGLKENLLTVGHMDEHGYYLLFGGKDANLENSIEIGFQKSKLGEQIVHWS